VARSFRFAVIAAALLALTEALTLLVRTPVAAVTLPPVVSYAMRDWTPGRIVTSSHALGGVRLIQAYTSALTGDTATVETRCGAEPKEFLKWTGRLAYEGAGYQQVRLTVTHLSTPPGAAMSEALMRDATGRVEILYGYIYGYIDHWGIHAETAALWPRAVVDLATRRRGLYCALAVAVPIRKTQQQAAGAARVLARAFLARIDHAVRSAHS